MINYFEPARIQREYSQLALSYSAYGLSVVELIGRIKRQRKTVFNENKIIEKLSLLRRRAQWFHLRFRFSERFAHPLFLLLSSVSS